jgi:hypothetical protein
MNHRVHRLAGPAALACLLLTACGHVTRPKAPPEGLVAERCPPGVCVIQVFVDDCSAPGGIRLDKPLVEVTAAVNMRWVIVTPGFVFTAAGIEFDPPAAQFEAQHSPQANEFRLHNQKARNGDFYYAVNVQGCRKHDPWVRNIS